MIYIVRDNIKYGPYDTLILLDYINKGRVLLCDTAIDIKTSEVSTVKQYLKSHGLKSKVQHSGNLLKQLKIIGYELIIPRDIFISKQWISDKRLLNLAIVGLFPSVLSFIHMRGVIVFYLISLYFSLIWGLFFYSYFKTNQVTIKRSIFIFFSTQVLVFILWDFFDITSFNPFYKFIDFKVPLSFIGYILGVGLFEELGKAIPLCLILNRAKEPLKPQTIVYYGLMSGIAFGVYEGVKYQTTINMQLDYTSAFLMNIARLTSLPFLHAIWTGIFGYFIAFSNLYPRYRISLYVLAIAIPSILHGVYDTFCSSSLGIVIEFPIIFIGVILLMSYLKNSINYQYKLKR